MKPREQINVAIKANKQAVNGLEAEKNPMLKNILLSSPI